VFKKIAPQLFLSITNSNIVIIINQKPFQESKEGRSLRVYRSRRLKKIFILDTLELARAYMYVHDKGVFICYLYTTEVLLLSQVDK